MPLFASKAAIFVPIVDFQQKKFPLVSGRKNKVMFCHSSRCLVNIFIYQLRLWIRSQSYVRIFEAYPQQIFGYPYIQKKWKTAIEWSHQCLFCHTLLLKSVIYKEIFCPACLLLSRFSMYVKFLINLDKWLQLGKINETAIWLHIYQKGAPNVYRGYKYLVPYMTYQFDTNVW